MSDKRSPSDAVWSGDVAGVEAAIQAGVDVNASEDDRWPPLHLAIEQVAAEIVRRLIAAGAEVNRDFGGGRTPLVHAIDIESDTAWQASLSPDQVSTELTESLLGSGATPTDMAIKTAEQYGNHKALALLRRVGRTPE